jgi:hypothetical protein
MLGLLGLRIFEATGADITDLSEEHGHRVLRVCGKGTKVVLIPLPPAVGRAIDRAISDRTGGPILLNSRGTRMDRHAATRRLRHLADASPMVFFPLDYLPRLVPPFALAWSRHLPACAALLTPRAAHPSLFGLGIARARGSLVAGFSGAPDIYNKLCHVGKGVRGCVSLQAGLVGPRQDRLGFRSVLHLPGVFEDVPGDPAGRVARGPAVGYDG